MEYIPSALWRIKHHGARDLYHNFAPDPLVYGIIWRVKHNSTLLGNKAIIALFFIFEIQIKMLINLLLFPFLFLCVHLFIYFCGGHSKGKSTREAKETPLGELKDLVSSTTVLMAVYLPLPLTWICKYIKGKLQGPRKPCIWLLVVHGWIWRLSLKGTWFKLHSLSTRMVQSLQGQLPVSTTLDKGTLLQLSLLQRISFISELYHICICSECTVNW